MTAVRIDRAALAALAAEAAAEPGDLRRRYHPEERETLRPGPGSGAINTEKEDGT